MSGFLPDLAAWALGGSGSSPGNSGNANADAGAPPEPPTVALTAEELRAQRLARMEELERRQRQQQQELGQQNAANAAATAAILASNGDDPMEIDVLESTTGSGGATSGGVASSLKAESKVAPAVTASALQQGPNQQSSRQPREPPAVEAGTSAALSEKKRKAKPDGGAATQQRKKELLLKKVLQVSLAGGVVEPDASSVVLDLDSLLISSQSIAEILATRLALQEANIDKRKPNQQSLLAYLALSHRKAAEEARANPKKQQPPDDLLEEIQRQVVSYAVTCLREPDLFPAGQDSVQQLALLLLNGVADPVASITFGASGTTSSFYHRLVEEFLVQDAVEDLHRLVGETSSIYLKLLAKCETVLESTTSDAGLLPSPVSVTGSTVVAAMTALASHKRVAEIVTELDVFLLPPADSHAATEMVRPSSMPRGNILQMLTDYHPYLKRSGPALEKHTLLGGALKVGVPRTNPAFSPTTIMTQPMESVERNTTQQQQLLRNHQAVCYQLIMTLIKGGTGARNKVMHWLTDALLVNKTADGMRPDLSKVSSRNLLLNVLVILLKLCEPFVDDDNKIQLIDPGFVMSESDHHGVFALSGPDAVPRLGENMQGVAAPLYNPKNRFIPQCFFYCARSLRYSLHAGLDLYENVSRQLSFRHNLIASQGRDLRSDAEFAHFFAMQRGMEVSLFEPEMIVSACRFCIFTARVLCGFDDDRLRTMPEDFVDDVCEIIMAVCTFKPKLLTALDFRHVFHLMVKLLSPTYASVRALCQQGIERLSCLTRLHTLFVSLQMVRNYNLRAKIGDVLFELFLPPMMGERRETPANVYVDNLAGGQTFLLSDKTAQDTLAPSLLLLYGEVEHTGFYDKMSHRSKIASLIKYLWESSQHRPAFRRITQDKDSFIKFANGIMNETNTLIATVMQKLPEIREAQERMRNAEDWGRLNEEQQKQIEDRLSDNQREVKYALPLCNRTIQMLSYLNTDSAIRQLFLLKELCPRLVQLLLHVLTRLVGSKGLNLKVDNPEQYEFRPKEMLRDLCAIFALFGTTDVFQEECARNECDPNLLRSAVKTCKRLNLLTGASITAFEALPGYVEAASLRVAQDEQLYADAPDEFLDELMATFMKDPVRLPSGHYVDRSTITQHLLNDPTDPFNRAPLSINDVEVAAELKSRMDQWLDAKRQK